MKISQIQLNMRNLTVIGRVVRKGDIREVETKFGPAQISWAVLKDETGEIRLNLWRGQIGMVRVGDTIRLTNAFVRDFQGQMELNIGADGRIEVLERSR